MFDGQRSYAEIAELYSQENSVEYDAKTVARFRRRTGGAEFWYKTPQEKNILLMQQTAEERRKKMQQRSRWADLSMVVFPAFNPDKFSDLAVQSHPVYLHPLVHHAYALFFRRNSGNHCYHWSEIGRDTVGVLQFCEQNLGRHFRSLWTCFGRCGRSRIRPRLCSKHFGARVSAMGFALVFLTPALYTDTTEGEVTDFAISAWLSRLRASGPN